MSRPAPDRVRELYELLETHEPGDSDEARDRVEMLLLLRLNGEEHVSTDVITVSGTSPPPG